MTGRTGLAERRKRIGDGCPVLVGGRRGKRDGGLDRVAGQRFEPVELGPDRFPCLAWMLPAFLVVGKPRGDPLALFDDRFRSLSHHHRIDPGSYGYPVAVTLTGAALADALAHDAQTLTVRLEVLDTSAGGLAIYGAGCGSLPKAPTLYLIQ